MKNEQTSHEQPMVIIKNVANKNKKRAVYKATETRSKAWLRSQTSQRLVPPLMGGCGLCVMSAESGW